MNGEQREDKIQIQTKSGKIYNLLRTIEVDSDILHVTDELTEDKMLVVIRDKDVVKVVSTSMLS